MNDGAGHTPELHLILDRYVQAVQDGAAVADCLADCRARWGAAAAAELRPALEAAALTARLRPPALPAASVDALEMRLRGALVARRRVPALGGLGRLAAMVAIALLALIGAGGGAVAAADSAVPGEALYPVKRLWEEIVLALSPLTGEQDVIWLWIAQRRLQEAEILAARGQLTPEALASLLDAMEHTIALTAPPHQPALRAYLDSVRAVVMPLAPPPGAESVYGQVLHSAAPPASALPPAQTPTPTLIALTATLTASPSATITPAPTLTLTPTSRVPATATRTPPPPTPTLTRVPPSSTPNPSATPTLTWTPLPLPASPVFVPPTPSPTASPPPSAPPTLTPELLATERWRATQAAVYLTQTAQAQPNSAPELAATETP
ncbi:MAG: hypothetical protein BroJett033_8680 [Chloroflexota bacterium]|nr:MAG: hypothetical protein BroJett033_8680 [Chloroflexota bacterium]